MQITLQIKNKQQKKWEEEVESEKKTEDAYTDRN